MATVPPKPKRTQPSSDIPLLYAGDHLSQPEFHRRYEAYPKPNVRFELIGGIVYMMTPVGYDHGRGDYKLGGITLQYEAATLGVEGATNTTVQLSDSSEPQPDAMLMLSPEFGGQTKISGDKIKYIAGPPEMVIEVAHSSVAIDLNRKYSDYRTAGVREYIVFDVAAEIVHWFDLLHDQELSISEDGILRSFMFPGYWLDTRAIRERNVRQLCECMARGIASDEHQKFVEDLAHRRDRLLQSDPANAKHRANARTTKKDQP